MPLTILLLLGIATLAPFPVFSLAHDPLCLVQSVCDSTWCLPLALLFATQAKKARLCTIATARACSHAISPSRSWRKPTIPLRSSLETFHESAPFSNRFATWAPPPWTPFPTRWRPAAAPPPPPSGCPDSGSRRPSSAPPRGCSGPGWGTPGGARWSEVVEMVSLPTLSYVLQGKDLFYKL